MVENLKKNHELLCTSRRHNEVSKLAKIRDIGSYLMEQMLEFS